MRTLTLWALCLGRLVLADVMNALGYPMNTDNADGLVWLTMVVFIICVWFDWIELMTKLDRSKTP